jgi:protoporphyrinogen oxidase
MKIAIIGGGISGLASAYELMKDKHEVVVYESDADIGGIASSFDFKGEFIERYYHSVSSI